MSKCGYYSCFKGKPTCKHPTYGETKTQCMRAARGGGGWHPCDLCKITCHGIYPSDVPRSEWNGDVAVVDKDGHRLD